ncbi:WD domain, G-beta repeat protein [Cooperia oncophora]
MGSRDEERPEAEKPLISLELGGRERCSWINYVIETPWHDSAFITRITVCNDEISYLSGDCRDEPSLQSMPHNERQKLLLGLLGMTQHLSPGVEKEQQPSDDYSCNDEISYLSGDCRDEPSLQSMPHNDRQKLLLGIFLDCFEALRSKEIEAAKRDLERCRRDRNHILLNGTSKTDDGVTSADNPDVSLPESLEPKTKRARCRGPAVEITKNKASIRAPPCSTEWPTPSKLAGETDVKHEDSSPKRSPTRNSNGLESHDGRVDESSSESKLSEFGKIIEETTRYGETVQLASLKYDISSAAYQSTVSSLEFSSADNSLFSVADISRTIQVFDINTVLKDPTEFHYPIAKMDCNAKISCVAWSPLMASVMVNSGYDGSVTVWDINKVRRLRKFNEHEKRCWSVSFARTDNHICATGSNDCSVKIWNLNMANSVMTIRPYFVVCTVNFGFTKNELAVGSAAECTRVFYGHRNTKNFVGLSSCGDHILTGSEDNRAYVYYKAASRPILCYDVDSTQSIVNCFDADSSSFENDSEVFVSAVAWRPDSDEVLVGNSVGKVDVLKLR